MIQTIQKITCDDTGSTYEVRNGRQIGDIPQLWEIELQMRILKFPGCRAEGSPIMTKKLVVERQLLVDAQLLPRLSRDSAPPSRDTNQILLELLAKVGVVRVRE